MCNTTDPIKKSKGTYQKKIVPNYTKGNSAIIPRKHKGYYFFEIEIGKTAYFHLEVIHASNYQATSENVYWVAQTHESFGTVSWLAFTDVENTMELHDLLMELNKGSIYGEKIIDGVPNPDYHEYTKASTHHVGRNYVSTNPFVDKLLKGEKDQNVYYGNFAYSTNKLGNGIWLEGINYYPEWKSQGAFIIAVDEPQILSLWAEKRTIAEKKVKEQDLVEFDTDHVFENLIYGDYLDLHICLHNVLDYTAHLEIYCGDDSMDEDEDGSVYHRIISLEKHFNNENPSLNYNLKFYDELLVDLRWADRSGHDEGKKNNDSLLDYKFILVLTPHKRKKDHIGIETERKTLKKEVTFTVNYKSDFSLDYHEPEYVEQVAYIRQAPLVSQSFESCLYTDIEISGKGFDYSLILLKENNDGSLIDNKTPYLEFVAGNQTNLQEITINISGIDVNDCEANLLIGGKEKKVTHKGNTINTNNITPIVYEKGKTLWQVFKNSNIFPEVQPFQEVTKTDSLIKFRTAYPYNAFNEGTFLAKFSFIHLQPVVLPITIDSCRYRRTPQFFIYADVIWAAHMNYDPEKTLFFRDEKVDLVEGYGDWMSFVALAVEAAYEPMKDFIGSFNKGNEVQKIIEEFITSSKTPVSLGLHAKYDKDKIINYATIQPYKAYLYTQIVVLVILSIAVDVLLLYLTRGKVSPGLAKAAKVVKSVNKFKDKYNLSFDMPKISLNFGFYREQHSFGKTALIFEGTMQAKPLLGISTTYDFDPKELPEGLEKFSLKTKVTGKITIDINFKFNSATREFTVNNNGKDQEGCAKIVLRPGDIMQTQGVIAVELKASGKYKGEFEVLNLFPVTTTIEGSIDLSSAIGFIRKIGCDAQKGPFFEDILFFDGLKGTYKQRIKVKASRVVLIDTDPDDKIEDITIFEPTSTSTERNYIFNIFAL
jgi:hypothetical protein